MGRREEKNIFLVWKQRGWKPLSYTVIHCWVKISSILFFYSLTHIYINVFHLMTITKFIYTYISIIIFNLFLFDVWKSLDITNFRLERYTMLRTTAIVYGNNLSIKGRNLSLFMCSPENFPCAKFHTKTINNADNPVEKLISLGS